MEFTFAPMTEEDARAVQAWRYEREYAVYNMGPDDPEGLAEMLDRRSPYYAARDEDGSLVGYFVFGASAGIQFPALPTLYDADGAVKVGLGLRPDLTGKGLGLAFVNAGLAFARQQFEPSAFRLFVMPFNERAIRVYERAGFERVGVVIQRGPESERPFLEMRRTV